MPALVFALLRYLSIPGDDNSLPQGHVLIVLDGIQRRSSCGCTGRDGELRLVQGGSGAGYEYGRLEIFLRGFWSTICDTDGFTPDSAQVACSILGYDGGSSIQFRQPYSDFQAENEVGSAVSSFC